MGTITRLYVRSMKPPRIVLHDVQNNLVSAWTQLLDPLKFPWVDIYHGEFGDLASSVDALVVPINHLGIMDDAYLSFFGKALQQELLRRIRRKYRGNISVGQAVVLSAQSRVFPFVICTPIAPAKADVGKEFSTAYVVTRTILDLWQFGTFERRLIRRKINSIAIPGLHTTSDSASVEASAKQQFRALREAFVFSRDGQKRRLLICADRLHDLR